MPNDHSGKQEHRLFGWKRNSPRLRDFMKAKLDNLRENGHRSYLISIFFLKIVTQKICCPCEAETCTDWWDTETKGKFGIEVRPRRNYLPKYLVNLDFPVWATISSPAQAAQHALVLFLCQAGQKPDHLNNKTKNLQGVLGRPADRPTSTSAAAQYHTQTCRQ